MHTFYAYVDAVYYYKSFLIKQQTLLVDNIGTVDQKVN